MSVAEAARVLDLTPDAIRMRLKRGSLNGEKRGAEWIVWLPATKQTAEHHRTNTDQTSEQTTGRDLPSWADLMASKDAALNAQAEEIVFLRGQLDQRSRELAGERERSDTLQRIALDRLESLAAGDPVVADDNAPDRGQDGPGGAEAVPTAPDAPRARPSSWLRRLWVGMKQC